MIQHDTYIYIHLHTTCRLTDDGVRAHFLANHGRIAAQKHRHRRGIRTGTGLRTLIHFTPVDGTILALVANRVDHLKLCVLLSCEAGVARQLLDGVIQGTEEKDQALAPICRLGKVPAHYTARNIEIDRLLPHGLHLGVSDATRLILGVGGPFQQPVTVFIASGPNRVVCKHLKLGTIERALLGSMDCWWRNNTVDRA